MYEIEEAFRDGLEASLHVLQIPSRSKTRQLRRDTIFDSAPRRGMNRKRVTTLMSIPSKSLDENMDAGVEEAMQLDVSLFSAVYLYCYLFTKF